MDSLGELSYAAVLRRIVSPRVSVIEAEACRAIAPVSRMRGEGLSDWPRWMVSLCTMELLGPVGVDSMVCPAGIVVVLVVGSGGVVSSSPLMSVAMASFRESLESLSVLDK